jgi:hypothetical protein
VIAAGGVDCGYLVSKIAVMLAKFVASALFADVIAMQSNGVDAFISRQIDGSISNIICLFLISAVTVYALSAVFLTNVSVAAVSSFAHIWH